MDLYVLYLHVIETCLKVMAAMFYFCHLKSSSNIMKNVLMPPLYNREKNSAS